MTTTTTNQPIAGVYWGDAQALTTAELEGLAAKLPTPPTLPEDRACARCVRCDTVRSVSANWRGGKLTCAGWCKEATKHHWVYTALLLGACAYLEQLLVRVGVHLSYGHETDNEQAWFQVTVNTDGAEPLRMASVNPSLSAHYRLQALRRIWASIARVNEFEGDWDSGHRLRGGVESLNHYRVSQNSEDRLWYKVAWRLLPHMIA